jgi:hypothetical protein
VLYDYIKVSIMNINDTRELHKMDSGQETRTFLTVLMLMVVGTVGRMLMQDNPINLKNLVGEVMLSAVIAVTLFAVGAMQNMHMWQIIFVGGLAGIGGVKIIEIIIQVIKQLSKQN